MKFACARIAELKIIFDSINIVYLHQHGRITLKNVEHNARQKSDCDQQESGSPELRSIPSFCFEAFQIADAEVAW